MCEVTLSQYSGGAQECIGFIIWSFIIQSKKGRYKSCFIHQARAAGLQEVLVMSVELSDNGEVDQMAEFYILARHFRGCWIM